MDNEIDDKIKKFITKDKRISDRANQTFDNFINEVRNDNVEKVEKQYEYVAPKQTKGILRFKKLIAIAASLMIVFVGADIYAKTHGYENVFFMIRDLTTPKEEVVDTEIFEDKDIIISYKYFQVTDNVEMQINELQIKDNTAKLYLLVRETNENNDVPLSYKVYNEENTTLYEGKSAKEENQTKYTEVLKLSNYKEDTNELKLEIFDQYNKLVKTVTINLEEKTIEARTENAVVQKISKVDLNKFLREETENLYASKELKEKQVIILQVYDIHYSNGKYIAKYLFMTPTDEEFEKNTVEETTIYSNTIEFTYDNNIYKKINIEKPEIEKNVNQMKN